MAPKAKSKAAVAIFAVVSTFIATLAMIVVNPTPASAGGIDSSLCENSSTTRLLSVRQDQLLANLPVELCLNNKTNEVTIHNTSSYYMYVTNTGGINSISKDFSGVHWKDEALLEQPLFKQQGFHLPPGGMVTYDVQDGAEVLFQLSHDDFTTALEQVVDLIPSSVIDAVDMFAEFYGIHTDYLDCLSGSGLIDAAVCTAEYTLERGTFGAKVVGKFVGVPVSEVIGIFESTKHLFDTFIGNVIYNERSFFVMPKTAQNSSPSPSPSPSPAPTPAPTYTVGQGSSDPGSFIDAYNRIGHYGEIGAPLNAVHEWWGGCIQDFNGGRLGRSAIMQSFCSGTAHPVTGSHWAWMERNFGGNAGSVVGYPTNDSHPWGNGWVQDFDHGQWGWNTIMWGNSTQRVHNIRGAIKATYGNFGGPDVHGYPVSDEIDQGGTVVQHFEHATFTYNKSTGNTSWGPRQIPLPGPDPVVGPAPAPEPAVNPIGPPPDRIDRVPGGILVHGWTLDPDTHGPIDVHVYANEKGVDGGKAQLYRPDVGQVYPSHGPNHGYAVKVNLGPGTYDVCAYGINVGPGSNTKLGCKTVTVNSNPIGSPFDYIEYGPDGITVHGWTIDPDTGQPTEIHIYADNIGVNGGLAQLHRPDVGAVFPAYGSNHGYAVKMKLDPGTYRLCAYGINVSHGTNAQLGCKAVTVEAGNSSFNGPKIWAINANNNIFFWNGGMGWENISGPDLVQVDVGPTGDTWGVDAQGKVYRHLGNGSWKTMPGNMSYVSSGLRANGTGKVWAINSNNDIFYWNGGAGWASISGPNLVQLDVGPTGEVWGIDTQGKVYRHLGNGSWKTMPGNMARISVGLRTDGGHKVMAVDANHNIYLWNGGAGWENVSGPNLIQLDIGPTGVTWGVDVQGKVYRYLGNGAWESMPGNMTSVVVGAKAA